MEITIQLIKQLRDKTGAGMADCKNALNETQGDIEKAIEVLRKKGAATASKRAEKSAKEGAVKVAKSDDKKIAAIVELNCETDFVAKGDGFQSFTDKLAALALNHKVSNTDELLNAKTEEGITVKEAIDSMMASVGEKVELRRVKFIEMKNGFVSSYVHFGSKLAGLVAVQGTYSDEAYDLGNKIAMQLVAMNPLSIDRDGIPKDIIEKEREIYIAAAKNEGKPDNIAEKIVENRLGKFYNENCLLEQEYINESGKSVGTLIKEFEKKSGGEFKVVEIVRYQLGL